MANAKSLSINQAAILLGKNRETIRRKVEGLHYERGPKGAKLYDADEMMYAIYCGSDESMMAELGAAIDDM